MDIFGAIVFGMSLGALLTVMYFGDRIKEE